MKDFKISILGSEWSVLFQTESVDKMLEKFDGYIEREREEFFR